MKILNTNQYFYTQKTNDNAVYQRSSKNTDFKKISDEKKENWRRELISNLF
jgi:hypothetical protein